MNTIKLALLAVAAFVLGTLFFDHIHSARADAVASGAGSGSGFTLSTVSLGAADDAGVPLTDAGIVMVDAGTGAGSATTTPSDQLHDPVLAPAATLTDLEKAKSAGWAAVVFAVIVILIRLGNRLAPSITWLAWIAQGRIAVALGFVGAAASAAYNSISSGGNWTAIFFAAVLAGFAAWDSTKNPPIPNKAT